MSDERTRRGSTEPRADARRNAERVLQAARDAFARHGFEAGYHDIARIAGVGVGTVYRRFPDRDALVEAVLLDILAELTAAAAVRDDADGWSTFERFFRRLADRMHHHAGLSAQAGVRASAAITLARTRLGNAVGRLCHDVAPCLREEIIWQDVMILAQTGATDRCGMGGEATEDRHWRLVTIVLDGLRRV